MPDQIDPVAFGKVEATVGHLKEQSEVTHRRIDKLDVKIVGLSGKVDSSHTDIMLKLNEMQGVQNQRGGFLKGMWRTIAVIGAVVAGIAAIVTGTVSCLMNM